MAGFAHFIRADTVRELVYGEFVELSPGGERSGSGGEQDRSLATRVTEADNLLRDRNTVEMHTTPLFLLCFVDLLSVQGQSSEMRVFILC